MGAGHEGTKAGAGELVLKAPKRWMGAILEGTAAHKQGRGSQVAALKAWAVCWPRQAVGHCATSAMASCLRICDGELPTAPRFWLYGCMLWGLMCTGALGGRLAVKLPRTKAHVCATRHSSLSYARACSCLLATG
eukprot:295242-Chlamydomonas_euryale.AAC.4